VCAQCAGDDGLLQLPEFEAMANAGAGSDSVAEAGEEERDLAQLLQVCVRVCTSFESCMHGFAPNVLFPRVCGHWHTLRSP
jgi:hypothetical protein